MAKKKIEVFQCAMCRGAIYRTGKVDALGAPENTHIPPGFQVTAGNLTHLKNWEYLERLKRLDTLHVARTMDEYKDMKRAEKRAAPSPTENINNVVSMEQFRKNKDQS